MKKAYFFHPVAAVYDRTFAKAVNHTSRRYFGEAYRPSLLVNLITGAAFYYLLFSTIDESLDDLVAEKKVSDIMDRETELRNFIQYDLRTIGFIEASRDFGDLDLLRIGNHIAKTYNDYYLDRLREPDIPPSLARSRHKPNKFSDPLFSVKNLLEEDLQRSENFYIPSESLGRIPERTKDKIFLIEDRLIKDYEQAYRLVGLDPFLKGGVDITETIEGRERFKALSSDPRIQRLLALGERLKVEPMLVVQTIQLLLYYDRSFDIWNLLGIKKFRLVEENGEIRRTDDFLTKQDIETELIEKLTAQSKGGA